MKINILKISIIVILFSFMVNVNALIKCDEGKPGDTVNCVLETTVSGLTKNIKMDNGLTFVNCDVCDESGNYSISENEKGNFKFKINSSISETKNLNVSIAGENGIIKVKVEEAETPDEISYTVTLVPGNGQNNITQSCIVNTLNTTCNITLEELFVEGFNGWGADKNCTSGSKGNIKVNKDVTYYACYLRENTQEENADNVINDDVSLLLKSLVVKNQNEDINIGFSMRIKEYEISVPTSVERLDIEALPQQEDVNVSVSGNENLTNDINEIKITLTNNDKVSEYIIKVIKKDEIEVPLLSNLVIGGYKIDFDPNKFTYSVNIDSGINKLSVEPYVDNEMLEVETFGNSNLKNGSQIKIEVRNTETEEVSTYLINITQESNNLVIYLCVGAVLLVILIILLIIVIKKGKKNNKTKKNVNKQDSNVLVKPVSNQGNIPEVKPSVMAPPTVNNSVEKEKNNDLEVLDL